MKIVKFAEVAQLVEQLICNQLVGGSSPFFGSEFEVLRIEAVIFIVHRNLKFHFSTNVLLTTGGDIPEWPNGADCKSAVYDFGGSNPSVPTNGFENILSGSSSVGRASAFQAEGRGFESRLPLKGFRS